MAKAAQKGSLLSRLAKTGQKEVVKMSNAFTDSFLLNGLAEYSTSVYAINIALSGKIDGGLISGLLVIAGPSKHFKTMYGLIMAKAYLDANPDGILLFYDSEFGASVKYFESVGIDPERVLHVPITDIEQLKQDMAIKLSPREDGAIQRGEKVCILIDSIGNLASAKETLDAENENQVADMSRAKAMKSLFRIVTPRLRLLDIPLIAINHTYQTQEKFSKAVVSGGTGVMYSANDVWIIGKSQIKDEEGLSGFTFTINIEKSRRLKEKSKIPVKVSFKGGISKYSGIYELAQELEYVTTPKVGYRTRPLLDIQYDQETGEVKVDDKGKTVYKLWREKEIFADEAAFFEPLFAKTNFKQAIEDKYAVASGQLLQNTDLLEEEDFSAFEAMAAGEDVPDSDD